MGIIAFCAQRGQIWLLRRWAEGFFVHFSSLTFALSGLALHSFFFAAPKKNEPKRRGPKAGKELGLWPQTAFPEAGDAEKQHLPNHQNKWFIQTNRPQITFPEAGNLDYILYAFIKGSKRGCRVSWNLSSGHIFIHIIAGEEGYLTREKLFEAIGRVLFPLWAPFFW